MTLENITLRILDSGTGISAETALELNDTCTADALADAADRVRARWCGDRIDTCSIANARSGRCSEDCAWCAQSCHFHTGIDEYGMADDDNLDTLADAADRMHVERFSLVTSGRKVAPADIPLFADKYRHLARRTHMKLCASMGLLSEAELLQLADAGVSRYHCNLETSARYFPHLCSTHTQADKLRTIEAARRAGMEICSGGIIGMGENMADRLDLCRMALEAGAVSIPINILQPIPGTPLATQELISEEDVVRTVALFRLMAPKTVLRFAGGRARLSEATTARILRGGMNGIMVGDLLTTVNSSMDRDYTLINSLGLHV